MVPNYSPYFTIAKMTKEAMFKRTITFSPGDYGRPLLHRNDSGNLLVSFCESKRKESSMGSFTKFLVPGCFTPFKTYADVVKATVKELELVEEFGEDPQETGGDGGDEPTQMSSKKPIELISQDKTPDALRARCESRAADELKFVPKESLIKEGLRDSCIMAFRTLRHIHGPDVGRRTLPSAPSSRPTSGAATPTRTPSTSSN